MIDAGLVTHNEVIESLLEAYRSEFFFYLAQPLPDVAWSSLARELEATAFDCSEPEEAKLWVLARCLETEAQNDVEPIEGVLREVLATLSGLGPDQARAMTLDVVRRALIGEQVVVGQFIDASDGTTPFVRWRSPPRRPWLESSASADFYSAPKGTHPLCNRGRGKVPCSAWRGARNDRTGLESISRGRY